MHVSFRISEDTIDQLKEDASHQNVNLNAFAGQIFWKYISFDRFANHVHAVTISQPVFRAMIDAISRERMEGIGEEIGFSLVRRTFSFMNIEYDLDTLIHRYFEPSQYSRWYRFNVASSSANVRLSFDHTYGIKWSAFLKNYLGSIVHSATGNQPQTTIDNNIVTISTSPNKLNPHDY